MVKYFWYWNSKFSNWNIFKISNFMFSWHIFPCTDMSYLPPSGIRLLVSSKKNWLAWNTVKSQTTAHNVSIMTIKKKRRIWGYNHEYKWAPYLCSTQTNSVLSKSHFPATLWLRLTYSLSLSSNSTLYRLSATSVSLQ